MGIRDYFRRFREAGRVLSRKNEERLRRLVAEASAILEELDGAVSEADRSMGQTFGLLSQAVQAQFSAPRLSAWLEDAFDEYLILRMTSYSDEGPGESAYYQVDYQIEAGDRVTFGEPIEVVKRVVYEPVSAEELQESGMAGEIVPLIERGLRPDGTGRIKIIAPGWGSSGFYPAEVLERDGPAIFPAGTHMYLDHPSLSEQRERPERSVEHLAGVTTSNAIWEANGPAGAGLYADIEVKPSVREDLNAIADHIGVSIIATGAYQVGEAEGRKGRIITALKQGESIDFVTRAGAGGAILPLLESRRTAAPSAPEAQPQEDSMSQEQIEKLGQMIEAQNKEIARLREAALLREARDQVQRLLDASGLAQPMRQRLARTLANECPVTEAGQLDSQALGATVQAAIDEERAYLGEVAPTGRPRGVGASAGAANEAEDFDKVFAAFLGK